ncbi:MAG: A24 family peptidase C-terminal domain-containing protein [Candidatus Hodarchaeales archaeon]|jgi:hypothetical protein
MAIWYEFEILNFLFVLIIFGLAAYQDYRTREISDLFWLILIFVSFPINFIRILVYWQTSPQLLLIGSLSVFTGIVLVIIMTYLGIWGGADLLALFSISLLLPYPVSSSYLASLENLTLEALFPFSLTIILNSALLQIPIPLIIFLKNFKNYKKFPENYREPVKASKLEKYASMFIGSPEKPERIVSMHPWYYRFMEEFVEPFRINQTPFLLPEQFIRFSSEPLFRYNRYHSLRKRNIPEFNFYTQRHHELFSLGILSKQTTFDHSIKLGEPEKDLLEQRRILDYLSKNKLKNRIWIQYSIPFIVIIFFGLISTFFVGNFLLLFLSFL